MSGIFGVVTRGFGSGEIVLAGYGHVAGSSPPSAGSSHVVLSAALRLPTTLRTQPYFEGEPPLRIRAGNLRRKRYEFDAYRQGVELLTPDHYSMGVCKIHAGFFGQTDDHGVPQLSLGVSQRGHDKPLHFNDTVPISPANLLTMSLMSRDNELLDRTLDLDVDALVYDGVLEPFSIRDVVARRAQSTADAHRVWGTLQEGNDTDRKSSDRFVNVVKDSDVRNGSYAMFDDISTVGGLVATAGASYIDTRINGPFEESEPAGVRTSSTMPSDVKTAVRQMAPTSGEIVPAGYTAVGCTGTPY